MMHEREDYVKNARTISTTGAILNVCIVTVFIRESYDVVYTMFR
jgi:hypothetical protein